MEKLILDCPQIFLMRYQLISQLSIRLDNALAYSTKTSSTSFLGAMATYADSNVFQGPKEATVLPEPQSYEQQLIPQTIAIEPKPGVDLFVERHHLLTTSFEYPRLGREPGLIIIFNQERFDYYDDREGSRRDVEEIVLCFGRLGFNINRKYIFHNLDRDSVFEKIDNILKEDVSEYNCVIVFMLTHGEERNQLILGKSTSMTTHELWNKFDECKDLDGKPKMFVFQACKGEKFTSTADGREEKSFKSIADDKESVSLLVPSNTILDTFMAPKRDMIVVYSSTEGNMSFRNANTGTWFIQELCRNFFAYGRRDDVVSLIMRVTKCVCRNYYLRDRNKLLIKQIPVFVSTLRKRFYLNRSKERHILLHILEEQHKLWQHIEELELKIKQLTMDKDEKRD